MYIRHPIQKYFSKMVDMIAQKSGILFFAQIFSYGLSFISFLFITNYLGAATYGQLSWILAFLAIFNCVSDLGFSNAHIKRISEGNNPGKCIKTYFSLKIILLGIMTLVSVIAIIINIYIYKFINIDTYIIILFLFFQIFYDIANMFITHYISRSDIRKAILVIVIEPIIRVPLIIFVCIFSMGLFQIACTYLVSELISIIIAYILLKNENIDYSTKPDFSLYFSFASSLMIITAISSVTINFEKFTVGIFSNEVEVAYYSSAIVICNVFGMLGTSMASIMFPIFSKMYVNKDFNNIKKRYFQIQGNAIFLILPLGVLLILFSYEIITTAFGPSFAAADTAFKILIMTTILTILN